MKRSVGMLGAAVFGPAVLAAGCQDQGFKEVEFDAIAVVYGDFDNMGDVLTAADIGATAYDGFIVQATYAPEDDRPRRGEMELTVEGLLTDTSGDLDLAGYNAVFVNSGTRGLNAWQYNNRLEPDDALLLDAENLQKTCDFVQGGGTLVAGDWAYDLIEFCWPDAIEFYGDNTVVDAAQVGVADDEVLAEVVRDSLKEPLGSAVSLTYNYTAWSVITDVGADTEVLLRGNIAYQPSETEPIDELQGAPLLVRFLAGGGQVVFSTFHLGAQAPSLSEALLLNVVEGLNPGDGSQSAEAASGS